MRWRTVVVLAVALLLLGVASVEAAKKKKKNTANEILEKFALADGSLWTRIKDPEGKVYYFNSKSGKSQWSDPRKDPAKERIMAMIVFSLPFLVMTLFAGGFLLYAYIYYPEQLKRLVKRGKKGVKTAKDAASKDKKAKGTASSGGESASDGEGRKAK